VRYTFDLDPSPPVSDEESWRDELADPYNPAYVTSKIADRLDGEDDPDAGLFFYVADFQTGVDVTVLTEDTEGRDVVLATYRLTITRLEDNK